MQRGSSSSPKRLSRGRHRRPRPAMRPSSSIAHLAEHLEGGDQEVPRAAAGVHHGDLGDAARASPRSVPAAGVPSSSKRRYSHSVRSGLSGWRAAHQAPSEFSSRKRHHVVLGEELGHRGEVGAADLALGGVDLLLLLGLPELVDPAEGVVGGEELRREVARGCARAPGGPRGRSGAGAAGSSGRKMPGSMRRRSGRRAARRRARLRRAASSAHSSRVTATPCSGWMSRSFSARKRAKSMRCHCS